MLKVQRISAADAFEALTPEWEQLEQSIWPRTPFTSPLWNTLWWKHFALNRVWVRDELYVHVVRDEQDALIAVAPMMLTCRPAYGPIQMRSVQLLGADENVTEIRSVVCHPEHQAVAFEALSRYFHTIMGSWDWLQWSGIPAHGPARELIEGGGRVVWEREIPNYYVALPGSWEELRAGLSRNMKEALRKCYNSLKRAGHEYRFEVIADPSAVGAALATFFDLHAARSEAGGTPHPNVFERPVAREFLTEYVTRLACHGQVRIFQLVVNSEVVATRVGFVFGQQLYLYYSGYKPQWGPHSVMTTVVAEAIRWAIAQGLRGVDLSTGKDQSKLRWRPTQVMACEGVQMSPSRFSGIAAHAYRHVVGRARQDTMLGKLLSSARRTKL